MQLSEIECAQVALSVSGRIARYCLVIMQISKINDQVKSIGPSLNDGEMEKTCDAVNFMAAHGFIDFLRDMRGIINHPFVAHLMDNPKEEMADSYSRARQISYLFRALEDRREWEHRKKEGETT